MNNICADYQEMILSSDWLGEDGLPFYFHGDPDLFISHVNGCKKCSRLYYMLKANTEKINKEYSENVNNSKQLKKIGYWNDNFCVSSVNPRMLNVSNCVDQKLIDYLKNGVEVAISPGFSFCRFDCGISDYEMGCRDFSDGVYIWPEGLSHYVEIHRIILPEFFINHAKLNRYIICNVKLDNLKELVLSESKWFQWCQQFKK